MTDFIESELENWTQIFDLNKHFLSPFIFRGQSDSRWTLETSIERSARNFSIFGNRGGYEVHEKWMMHEFKRKYPLYSSILPRQNDHFEWLAIMQHHGAPTRLLDFTESLLIASYFAVIDSTTESTLWFINRHILRDNLHSTLQLKYDKGKTLKDEIDLIHIDFANNFIADSDKNLDGELQKTVVPLEPKICTERLAKQQGLFLMPTNAKFSFQENIMNAFGHSQNFEKVPFDNLIQHSDEVRIQTNIKMIKINIPNDIHADIVYSLKQMNITAEVLFPGIDGLAKSLQQTHIRLF